ncbi:MAG: SMP-30/gluconolactonase/LRE family protein, partial [Chloroflexi bacterium]|nr:SMP-30/gluconolactonase/LRE family protein [Chloroflexota bacterium]
VAADGSVYFSDPYWGHFFVDPGEPQVRLEDRELPFQGLFRAAPDGNVTLLADDFGFPNGLAISPDGATLYVDDSDVGHIRAFDLFADGAVGNSRVFAEIGPPETGHVDGMKIDREGNLYCTGPGGVWVLDPSGTRLGRIRLPDSPSNLAWGEPDWRALFVTCRDSVFRVRLGIPGIPV